ncbi:MAG: hypothetical protein PVF66_13595 [Candidatus Aminicenantes bacterium]|jgi:hypothetical protein
MRKKRKKIILFSIIAFVILVCAIVFFRSPIGLALLKSKSHFIVHSRESRVLFEPGAEEHADKIAEFLPDAIKRVEDGHFKPFKKPFKVYVCHTQKSHNQFIADPSNYPIRGAALRGNVFISPAAFSFDGKDTHKESLTHELSHLHLSQRLGFFGMRKIPFWFSEGLANCIAGSGGEGISETQAIDSIKSGRSFTLREEGGLFKSWHKVVSQAGISARMFHRQNKMFVKFIMDYNPEAFQTFLLEVQEGKSFFERFNANFKIDITDMWEKFMTDIFSKSERNKLRKD